MKRKTPAPEALLTPNQLARIQRELSGSARAAIGPNVIRAAIAAGEIPHLESGFRVYVRWGDFLAYCVQRCQAGRPSSEPQP